MKQLQAARVYATKVHYDCISAIDNKTANFASHVTEQQIQVQRQKHEDQIKDILDGKLDGNFSVAQRMHYFLTGKSVPFLSAETKQK